MEFMKRNGMTKRDFKKYLEDNNIVITEQYLGRVMLDRVPPGPAFKKIFKQITGVTLVDGLIEDK